MTARELRQACTKLGIPPVLLANLCVVSTQEVVDWQAGHTPIPDSVATLVERMRWVPRKAYGFKERQRS